MRSVTILALLTGPADRRCLNSIVSHSNWKLHIVSTLQDAEEILRRGDPPVGVVITDRHLPTGECWTDVLLALGTVGVPPAFIVANTTADECVWAEVLNLGGYDLLIKPFDSAEVVNTVIGAWRAWNDRMEIANRGRKPPMVAGERQSEGDPQLLSETGS